MTSIPSVLEIGDALDRAASNTGEDISSAVADVRQHLAAASEAGTSASDVEGHLNDAQNDLLRIEERVDGDAARDLQAARNRIELYRNARGGCDPGLFVLETESRAVKAGGADSTEIIATIINERTPRDVRVIVTFYDDDDTTLDEVASDVESFDAGEQRAVEVETSAPGETSYYLVDVREAEDDAVADEA